MFGPSRSKAMLELLNNGEWLDFEALASRLNLEQQGILCTALIVSALNSNLVQLNIDPAFFENDPILAEVQTLSPPAKLDLANRLMARQLSID